MDDVEAPRGFPYVRDGILKNNDRTYSQKPSNRSFTLENFEIVLNLSDGKIESERQF